MPPIPRIRFRPSLVLLLLGALALSSRSLAADATDRGRAVTGPATAAVNFTDLARQEARLRTLGAPPVRVLELPEELNEMDLEPGANVRLPSPPRAFLRFPQRAFIASPAPSSSYIGLDDVPMVD